MIRIAWSMSYALRSCIFSSAISRTWSRDTVPTLARLGVGEPLSTPAAFLSRLYAGGVLVMKVNVRSSYTVISAGMTVSPIEAVRSLYALQNSMMLRPCGPSAVPIGGAGVALPACSCSLITVLTFFLLIAIVLSEPLDLEQVELNRGLTAEHVHEHLELALLDIDLGHLAMEVGERSIDDANVLSDLVLDVDLRRRLGLHLLLNPADLVLVH